VNAHVSREEKVLAFRTAGMSHRLIANALGISARQVRRILDPGSAERERQQELERARQRRACAIFPHRRSPATRDWLLLESKEPSGVRIEDVKQAAAEHFGVSAAMLLVNRRDAATVHRRHIAIFVACEEAGKTLPVVGRAFGGLDHTTVLHARRKIAAAIAAGDKLITADVEAIRARLKAGRAGA
jgi:transposase